MNRNHFTYLEYKSVYARCCCVYCNSFFDQMKNVLLNFLLGPVAGNDGKECPIICDANCNNETEIECAEGKDNNGCEKQPICKAKGRGNNNVICEGYCDEVCPSNTNTCQQPPNDDGCATKDACEPKQVDNNGNYCDEQHCKLTCSIEDQLCEGETIDGCKEADVCVPKQTNENSPDGLCPGTCPVECQNGWILCTGQIDYYGDVHKGCKAQDICVVCAKDANGQCCPEESDSHGCPKTCPPGTVLCPARDGPLGCKEEPECNDRSTNGDDEYCPESSDCPTVCPPNHVNCPGGVDDTGCKNPDLCIEEHRDFNGDICPVHCPENCKDDEVFCPGTRSPINGCYSKDTCADKETHQWGETPGAACPGWCPAICNDHEVLCPSFIDPCNGCPTEEICREAIKNVNGVFCPGKEHTIQHEGEDFRENGLRRGGYLSASHNCPVYCKEWEGEIQCPVYEDHLGCKPTALCMARQQKLDFAESGEYCPSTSVCPKQCPAGKKLCTYEDAPADADGCGHEELCVDIARDSQNKLCAMDWCPPICSGAETLQDNGVDEAGCPLAPTCV